MATYDDQKDVHVGQLNVVDSHGEGKVIDSKRVDEALAFLDDSQDVSEGEISEVDDKKLMRKVDWTLMPLMFACYYLQYSDKTLMSYASIMGIIKDTNMPPNGYSHLAIAFYVAFLFCEPIQAFMIQRFPTAKYLGIMVVCWGIVLTMNCVCHDFASLVVLRVLLGVFESVTAPALVVLTGMWYKRSEQVVRMGYWYQGTSIGPAVSSLVAYGFGKWAASDPRLQFKSWQVLFLIYGLVTIVIGILTFFFLPDNPMKSRLSHGEKLRIIERVRDNQTGIENKRFKAYQFKEVMLDVRTWLMSLIVITSNVPNGAVSSFSSIITENFGYNEYQSLLLQLPGCAIAFIAVWLATWYAGRYNGRGIAVIALIIPTLIGGALMAWLPAGNKGGLLTGNFLTNTVGASLPLLYSWVTANFAGHTKRVTMNAIVLMSFCVGNIIGPETFQADDAPQYIPAKMTIVIVLSFSMLITLLLMFLNARENKKRDRRGHVEMPHNYEFMDLTDKENLNFRYLL